MSPIEFLLLTEQEIAELLSMEKVMDAVESAFKERALRYVQMPPKTYLTYSKHSGDLRTMPAYLERLGISSVKVVTVHPDNAKRFNLPTVKATVLLVDPQNGQLLAILGGAVITSMRTGAAGGLAAKYLANRNSRTVSFIGAGVQARTQLSALQTVFPALAQIRVWDLYRHAAEAFVKEINAKPSQLHATIAETAKEAVSCSDIVVTTTPSTAPIVLDSWASDGTHFNCIGADAPGKEELEPALLKRAKVVVDDWVQASHSGEINVPVSRGLLSKADVWAELGEIIAGSKRGRTSPSEITLFDSTGLAIQDTMTADLAYKEAVRRNVGRIITM